MNQKFDSTKLTEFFGMMLPPKYSIIDYEMRKMNHQDDIAEILILWRSLAKQNT